MAHVGEVSEWEDAIFAARGNLASAGKHTTASDIKIFTDLLRSSRSGCDSKRALDNLMESGTFRTIVTAVKAGLKPGASIEAEGRAEAAMDMLLACIEHSPAYIKKRNIVNLDHMIEVSIVAVMQLYRPLSPSGNPIQVEPKDQGLRAGALQVLAAAGIIHSPAAVMEGLNQSLIELVRHAITVAMSGDDLDTRLSASIVTCWLSEEGERDLVAVHQCVNALAGGWEAQPAGHWASMVQDTLRLVNPQLLAPELVKGLAKGLVKELIHDGLPAGKQAAWNELKSHETGASQAGQTSEDLWKGAGESACAALAAGYRANQAADTAQYHQQMVKDALALGGATVSAKKVALKYLQLAHKVMYAGKREAQTARENLRDARKALKQLESLQPGQLPQLAIAVERGRDAVKTAEAAATVAEMEASTADQACRDAWRVWDAASMAGVKAAQAAASCRHDHEGTQFLRPFVRRRGKGPYVHNAMAFDQAKAARSMREWPDDSAKPMVQPRLVPRPGEYDKDPKGPHPDLGGYGGFATTRSLANNLVQVFKVETVDDKDGDGAGQLPTNTIGGAMQQGPAVAPSKAAGAAARVKQSPAAAVPRNTGVDLSSRAQVLHKKVGPKPAPRRVSEEGGGLYAKDVRPKDQPFRSTGAKSLLAQKQQEEVEKEEDEFFGDGFWEILPTTKVPGTKNKSGRAQAAPPPLGGHVPQLAVAASNHDKGAEAAKTPPIRHRF